jgi:4'-phosphopantetheinyl transferase EntD
MLSIFEDIFYPRSSMDSFAHLQPPLTALTWARIASPVFAEEEALLQAVSAASHQKLFKLGRTAAHKALESLGQQKQPILRGPRREPLWPAGVVGSISHTENIAYCFAALDKDFRSVGVDIEQVSRNPGLALQKIATPSELSLLSQAGLPGLPLFSAKEALYKCLYPVAQVFFGYSGAKLTAVTPGNSLWTLRLELSEDLGATFKQGQAFNVVLGNDSHIWLALTVL